MEVAADDGSFWMDFKQVQFYFSEISINKYSLDHFYSFIKTTQKPGVFSAFELEVKTGGEHTFSVSQQDSNIFSRYSKYEYSDCHMILMKKEKKGLKYIKGGIGYKQRDAYVEANLEVGTYLFFVEMEWRKHGDAQSHEFCATSYGVSKVDFKDVLKSTSRSDFLKQVALAELDGRKTEFEQENMVKKGSS